MPGTDLNPLPPNDAQTPLAADYRIEHAYAVARDLPSSFRYAWAGTSYAFRTQRNFRIHVAVGAIVLGLCVGLRLSRVEFAVMSLTVGAVLAMELLNTAIEATVDLAIGQQYHVLAKIAKDCSAAAVLISALTAVFVGSAILLPPMARVLWQAIAALAL